jgi:peroxiredoxin
MPPVEGETAPDFRALRCDGETSRVTTLEEAVARDGAVLVFFGFAFNAISDNWWRRYVRAGWGSFDVPVYGVGRDGPYAMNAFVRQRDLPFEFFADVEGTAAEAYGLLTEREGMAGVHTARRAVFVLDGDREVQYVWDTDEWIYPVPREEVEAAVAEL